MATQQVGWAGRLGEKPGKRRHRHGEQASLDPLSAISLPGGKEFAAAAVYKCTHLVKYKKPTKCTGILHGYSNINAPETSSHSWNILGAESLRMDSLALLINFHNNPMR